MKEQLRNILIITSIVIGLGICFLFQIPIGDSVVIDKWEVEESYTTLYIPTGVRVDNGHQYGITVEYESIFGKQSNMFYVTKTQFENLSIGDVTRCKY